MGVRGLLELRLVFPGSALGLGTVSANTAPVHRATRARLSGAWGLRTSQVAGRGESRQVHSCGHPVRGQLAEAVRSPEQLQQGLLVLGQSRV